jgi:hypothetical protein
MEAKRRWKRDLNQDEISELTGRRIGLRINLKEGSELSADIFQSIINIASDVKQKKALAYFNL